MICPENPTSDFLFWVRIWVKGLQGPTLEGHKSAGIEDKNSAALNKE